jgi:hypothetical protein
MSRPKLEARIQVWVPVRVAQAFEQLAADGMLRVSDHVRLALGNHLRQMGFDISAPPQPAQSINGQHQERANGL